MVPYNRPVPTKGIPLRKIVWIVGIVISTVEEILRINFAVVMVADVSDVF
jgi:hypothetical protein